MIVIVIQDIDLLGFRCFLYVEGQGQREVEDDFQVFFLGNWGDGGCLGRENNGFNFMDGG